MLPSPFSLERQIVFCSQNPLAVEVWQFVRVPRWMMPPDNKFGAVALR